MKKRKNSRRNLLVRFIRWVYKSLDTLFKRKKSTFRSTNRHKLSTEERDRLLKSAHLAAQAKDRLITVGELFDRVQWQFPEEDIQSKVLNLNSIPRPRDASNN
jgi:hypothetical protein